MQESKQFKSLFNQISQLSFEKRAQTLITILMALNQFLGPFIVLLEEHFTGALASLHSDHKDQVEEIIFFCLMYFNFGHLETCLPKLKKVMGELCPGLELKEEKLGPSPFCFGWLEVQKMRQIAINQNGLNSSAKYLQVQSSLTNLRTAIEKSSKVEIYVLENYEFYFRAWLETQIPSVVSEHKTLPVRERRFFFKNENLQAEENYTIEYKDYHFPLHDDLKKTITKLYCAFLNRRGGRVYIGVVDGTKKVAGLKVKPAAKAEILNTLKSLSSSILNDQEADNLVKISFVPLKDEKSMRVIADQYVIKILIKQGLPSKLYCIKRNTSLECYIRNNGMRSSSLDCAQICKLMMQRINNSNPDIVPSHEFDDPEPEDC